MEIELVVYGLATYPESKKQVLKEFVEHAIVQLSESLELSASAIKQVVIADTQNYKRALIQLGHSGGFTNEHGVLASGTTVVHRDGDTLQFSLVLQDYIVSSLIVETRNRQASDWLSVYAICHELGHCRDYLAREEIVFSDVRASTNRMVFQHNAATLASEFAACIFSSHILNRPAYELLANSVNQWCLNIIQSMQEQKRMYCDGQDSDLKVLQGAVSYCTWRILIEYAKLFAKQLGNHELRGLRLSGWDGISDKTKSVLDELSVFLEQIWQTYPDWDSSTLEPLFDLWQRFTLTFAFKAEERHEGSYLFFDC